MQKCSFFLCVLSKQNFCFFQTIELAKHAFVVRRYFLKMKNKTAEKIMGQCFPVKSKVKCKNLAHLAEKKKRPKKSFSLLTQAPLQCKVKKKSRWKPVSKHDFGQCSK